MKVGIDTFGCNHGQSGIGIYLASVCKHLHSDDSVEFELFGAESDKYTFGSENNLKYTSVLLPEHISAESLWHIFGCHKFFRKQRYDLVLFPAVVDYVPFFSKVPYVVIVNDVLRDSLESKTFMERLRLRHFLKKASRIIVSSQYIRKSLKNLGVNQKKVTVIHCGVDHNMFYPLELKSEDVVDIKPFSIQRPYFIYPSRISSASKKHCELIRAFAAFKQKTGLPYRLLFTGGEGDYSDIVRAEVARSSCASDIFITGYVPPESVPELYSASDGCIFPSVNEGVGLPVLESMAAGVPVACTKSGALQEITGNNAFFFDCDNIEEFTRAIEVLSTESPMRQRLIKEGFEWSAKFKWEKTSCEIVDVLKSVYEKRK